MTRLPSERRSIGIHFDNMSVLDKVRVVAHDPGFQALARELPQLGTSTLGRPSHTTTAGMLLVGLMTGLYGSDRRADAEMRAAWPQIRAIFEETGTPCPTKPMTSQTFRDFRAKFIERNGGLLQWNATIRDISRTRAVKRAREMGLLDKHPWSASDGWGTVPPHRILCGDATVFTQSKPSKEIRDAAVEVKGKNGRSKHLYGDPAAGTDVDRVGLAWGYSHVFVSVSGNKKRQHQLLDVVRARTTDATADAAESGDHAKRYEMTATLDAMRSIHALMPDADLAVAYDGAMRGEHEIEIRSSLGWMSATPARTTSPSTLKKLPKTEVPQDIKRVSLGFPLADGSTCEHQLALRAGTLWRVSKNSIGRDCYLAPVDHTDLVRVGEQAPFSWELEIELYCAEHQECHKVTIDPNSRMGGYCLADALRPLCQTNGDHWRAYGRRNTIESMNSYMKKYIMRTDRARSKNSQAHELDLRLAAIAINAIAWAEHGPGGFVNLDARRSGCAA